MPKRPSAYEKALAEQLRLASGPTAAGATSGKVGVTHGRRWLRGVAYGGDVFDRPEQLNETGTNVGGEPLYRVVVSFVCSCFARSRRKGFGLISRAGFVSRDAGVFPHHSQLAGSSRAVEPGDLVKFTLEWHPTGLRAADVRPARPGSV